MIPCAPTFSPGQALTFVSREWQTYDVLKELSHLDYPESYIQVLNIVVCENALITQTARLYDFSAFKGFETAPHSVHTSLWQW